AAGEKNRSAPTLIDFEKPTFKLENRDRSIGTAQFFSVLTYFEYAAGEKNRSAPTLIDFEKPAVRNGCL
ncbi:MAG: hypothetical protein RR872_03120, partial [Mucinivorans sp.]